MNTRTLIVIGAALVVLFACGVGGGVLRGGVDELNLDLLRDWEDRIDLARSLSLDDLENLNNCPRSGTAITVVANQTCDFQADSARLPIPRAVTLRLVQGSNLTVIFQQPEVLDVETSLSMQEAEEVTVYEEGGLFRLRCAGLGEDCRVQFE